MLRELTTFVLGASSWGVEFLEIGSFGRASGPHHALPERLSGSSRVRSLARSLEPAPQEARVVSCGTTRTVLPTCWSLQLTGELQLSRVLLPLAPLRLRVRGGKVSTYTRRYFTACIRAYLLNDDLPSCGWRARSVPRRGAPSSCSTGRTAWAAA